MKRVPIYIFSLFLLWIAGFIAAYADPAEDTSENSEPSILQTMLSLHSPQADLTFAGIVTNESGERYNYFFQIQRNYTGFHGIATIIDGQTNSVLIYEDSYTLIEQPELAHWQVGNIFLRFNPINNSWVFGMKKKGKNGFNFKVDMLGLADATYSKQQELRSGVALLINQTGRLNGHLVIEAGKEQFVTAKKAWFRQIWVSKPQSEKHALTSVLCEFNNGAGFYTVAIPEADSLRGSLAGWRDEQGLPVPVSQFVNVQKDKDDKWSIKISSPKVNLSFVNLLFKINEKEQLIAGMSIEGTPGFCAISQTEIDAHVL